MEDCFYFGERITGPKDRIGIQRVSLNLMHNVMATGSWRSDKMRSLRAPFLKYKLWEAKFAPYWVLDQLWPERPEAVHVSGYCDRTDVWTLVICNFGREAREVALPINLITGRDPAAPASPVQTVYPANGPSWAAKGTIWRGKCPPGQAIMLRAGPPQGK